MRIRLFRIQFSSPRFWTDCFVYREKGDRISSKESESFVVTIARNSVQLRQVGFWRKTTGNRSTIR